jgi:3-deoxy-7-phosphoheptulonate synthase
MLIRLRKRLPPDAISRVLRVCTELGLKARFLDGGRELLELEGPGGPEARSRLEDLAGVLAVLDAGSARELFARVPPGPRQAAGDGPPVGDTVVQVGAARFGGGHVSVIAGPCAVEGEERLVEIARGVRERGAAMLRGGAFKPRTSPYSFQGARHAGLERLARAKLESGLAVVTEVLDPRDVEAVGAVADMFQIGSRNMTNTPLLVEVGRSGVPVLLKRGFMATLRELLLAAEFVLAEGNPNVVLCERGIRGFDPSTRNVLDVGAVAHLKRATHLPVIVDPSHAAGRAELVRALARAGVAAGADGVIVEVHPAPVEVHCDGHQAIGFAELERVVADVRALCALDQRLLVTPLPQEVLP